MGDFDHAIRYEKYDANCHKFFVYVLELENGWYYIGQTKNICGRILNHFAGCGATVTKKHPPNKIVCIGVYSTREEVIKRETELINIYYKGPRTGRSSRMAEWKKKRLTEGFK